VIIGGEDNYGDGVNIGARLQAFAEPGTVLISGSAHDQVRDKLPYGFDDLGEHHVKNIAGPVRVYRVRPDVAGARWDDASAKLPRTSEDVAPSAASREN
jgi:class 3 adenylate cyclase